MRVALPVDVDGVGVIGEPLLSEDKAFRYKLKKCQA